jgi:hypothetical protein
MRLWLVIGVLVLAAVLVVIVPRLGSDDDPHRPRPGRAETLPAAVALTYARAVQLGEQRMACGTMTSALARRLGCGTAGAKLRACGDFSIPATLIEHYDRARATVVVGACRIDLVPGAETGWAVSKVAPA